MLYLNVGLLGRRHWPSGKGAEPLGWHYLARGLALMVAVAGLTILTARLGGRLDATAEGIHSLSDQTRQLIAGLDPNRPVFIQAFLSPDVPAKLSSDTERHRQHPAGVRRARKGPHPHAGYRDRKVHARGARGPRAIWHSAAAGPASRTESGQRRRDIFWRCLQWGRAGVRHPVL